MSKFLVFVVCCLPAVLAATGDGSKPGCSGAGKNIKEWFTKLGALSNEVAASCSRLPEADKVTALENKVSSLEECCKRNGNSVQQFAAQTQMRLGELEARVKQLNDSVTRQKTNAWIKKVQNGFLEKKGDICQLQCFQGTFAFPGKRFFCNESDACINARCVQVASCKELKKLMPSLSSGVYTIRRSEGSVPYQVYCDMTTDGGGWTLTAVIANGDNNNWVFGDTDRDYGDASSLWENDATLGQIDDVTMKTAKDFKSQAFIDVPAKELLITYKGQEYIQTGENCLGGFTMKRLFNIMRFSCAGSSYNCHYGKCIGTGGGSLSSKCDHSCAIARFKPPSAISSDPLANGRSPSKVLIKAGEAEGAQDGNKDRVYVSTWPYRNSVDYVCGLGSFTSLSGNVKQADISVHDDISKESTDRTLFYGLLVR